MIDAILLADAEILVPFLISHWHMGCEWKDAGVMLSSEECIPAVYGEMSAVALEVAEGECCLLLVGLALTFHRHLHTIYVLRLKFAPFHRILSEVIRII